MNISSTSLQMRQDDCSFFQIRSFFLFYSKKLKIEAMFRAVHSRKILSVVSLSVFFILLFSCELWPSSGNHAVFAGRYGNTFQIKEKDAYEELIERVRTYSIDRKFLSLSKKIPKHYVVNIPGLRKADRDSTRYHTPSYTLPFDIRDHNGKLIYPAGFTFNPLDHIRLPFILVFFDATSKEELSWIRKHGFSNRWDVILIATKGNIYDASLLLGKTVYAASENIIRYFAIERTPSYVYQEGNRFVIREVGNSQ